VVWRERVLGFENVLEKRGCWLEENVLVDVSPHFLGCARLAILPAVFYFFL
jgi:hypothetical protein